MPKLLITLLGIITLGLFTTGRKFDRVKYGGIVENPPIHPGRNFCHNFQNTSFQCSHLRGKLTAIYLFIK